MAIDAVNVGTHGTTSGTTATTTAGAVTTGDTLVAVASFDPGVTISSINDTAGNNFGTAKASLTGGAKLAMYVKENCTGHASDVLTIVFSGSAFASIHLIKITGAATASYDSGSLASGTDGTTPYTITSGGLAQAASVIISCVELNTGGNGNYTSANMTILSSETDVGNFWTSAVGKLVVASTSAVTPSWDRNNQTNATSALIVAAFKESGGGGSSGGMLSGNLVKGMLVGGLLAR